MIDGGCQTRRQAIRAIDGKTSVMTVGAAPITAQVLKVVSDTQRGSEKRRMMPQLRQRPVAATAIGRATNKHIVCLLPHSLEGR